MPTNPDPERFAKSVIAELAEIRATVDHMAELFVFDMAKRHNVDPEDMRREFKKRRDEKHEKFYQHYLREIGLSEE